MAKFLKNRFVYLSGAIENCNSEVNWRIEPIKQLKERFELNVFDPFADPKQQWTTKLTEARKNKNYDEMMKISKSFVRKDLCLVDRSDFLISYLPYKVPTTGSIHEVIVSDNAKKPTLIVCPQGAEYAPLWLWGFIPKEAIFGSFDELYNYLEEVNIGKHKHNRRWDYVCDLI